MTKYKIYFALNLEQKLQSNEQTVIWVSEFVVYFCRIEEMLSNFSVIHT